MEDKIKKILEKYKVYGAKQDLITEELLVLFSVVGQSEQCVLHSTDWNGKCFKCGEQVFVREEK